MSEHYLINNKNVPCPGCGFPMKQGESVVLNLGPGPAVRHATCVEAPLLRFKCPDHGIFEAHGYDNPVFYADKVADCPECGAKCWQPADNKPDTSLSLLVIDTGECCFLKVESGRYERKLFDDDMGGLGFRIIQQPFAAVRDAIDSQDKPVPRIERHESHTYCYNYYYSTGSAAWREDEYQDLCKLAGKPLPIYESGKWEQLFVLDANCDPSAMGKFAQQAGHKAFVEQFAERYTSEIQIWRYTR